MSFLVYVQCSSNLSLLCPVHLLCQPLLYLTPIHQQSTFLYHVAFEDKLEEK